VKTRSFMQLDLRTSLGRPAYAARQPRQDEREPLAELMLAAYRGAVDDEGETIAEARQEIENVLVNAERPLVPEASFVIELDGTLASASLVALFRGAPLIAHLMTDARYKRRGLGLSALLSSTEALRAQGWSTVGLYVTDSNEPAVTLYQKLGFQTISAAA
jgi:ribosomal protein S18 acetylase RimI-like enzyme